MESGKVIFEGKTKKGLEVTLRYPKADDLADLLNYINTISKEQTFIQFQGEQATEDEEKKYLEDILDKMKKNREVYLLLYSQSKMIGSASLTLREKAQKHVGDFAISIARGYRGQGLGKLLMDAVLEEAKKHLPGLKIFVLSVFANNSIAKKMYEEFGFKQWGILPKGAIHRGKLVDHIYLYKEI